MSIKPVFGHDDPDKITKNENKSALEAVNIIKEKIYGSAVYRVVLKQPRGISLVVTHCTADVRVTSHIPVTLGLVPVEPSTSISGSHSATYVVNSCVS